MSHVPEQPEQYVCLNCQVMYAGSVTHEDGDHHFHPPADCAVCGEPDFVEAGSYVHRSAARSE